MTRVDDYYFHWLNYIVGNGHCDSFLNSLECCFDGGDCDNTCSGCVTAKYVSFCHKPCSAIDSMALCCFCSSCGVFVQNGLAVHCKWSAFAALFFETHKLGFFGGLSSLRESPNEYCP